MNQGEIIFDATFGLESRVMARATRSSAQLEPTTKKRKRLSAPDPSDQPPAKQPRPDAQLPADAPLDAHSAQRILDILEM